jgi:hypothetical protein
MGWPLKDRGIAPRVTVAYSIRTGAPPVAVQIASQVRSSSGTTYGLARLGGGPAMMPGGYVSSRIQDRPEPAPVVTVTPEDPNEETPQSIRARLLTNLTSATTMEGVLPSRAVLRGRYGRGLLPALLHLERQGHLKLWLGRRGTSVADEMIIRVTGSDVDLRTVDAPAHIRL